jgi:hypothetical protein
MDKVMHFWCEITFRIKVFEIGEKELDLMTQMSHYISCAHWSKNIIYNAHKPKKIFPIFIILWNEITNEQRQVSPQTPR